MFDLFCDDIAHYCLQLHCQFNKGGEDVIVRKNLGQAALKHLQVDIHCVMKLMESGSCLEYKCKYVWENGQ